MRILFHKISDDRHGLEIVRPDGRTERGEYETKSVLLHDFTHFAVESEAGLTDGFWGALAAGKTLSDMDDRTGEAMKDYSGSMSMIERLVGALHGAAKGRPAAETMAGLRLFAESNGETLPPWLSEGSIARVQERIRKLVGHWQATPFGGSMEVTWPAQ